MHPKELAIANYTYTLPDEKIAAFPLHYVTLNKFWPSVARVNNTHGDRNLICTCEPMESYMDAEVSTVAEK